MEKRTMANVCRTLTLITAFSFAALAAHAQLINPGFETAGTNYVFPDNGDGSFPVLTVSTPAGWTFNGGAYASRCSTNSPETGSYEDFTPYDYNGIQSSGSTNTAHGGGYALRAFGTFTNACCVGSGAYQIITPSQNAGVSNGAIWVFSGYLMNWSGDQMQDFGAGVTQFGQIQILYQKTNGTTLGGGTYEGPQIGTNAAPDTWISCSVTGQAPVGTEQMALYCLHVGMAGAVGSVFFDDLSVTNIGVGATPVGNLTNQYQAAIQSGNQLCWPTTSYASYQPQYSDDNVNWTSIGSLLPGDGTTNCAFATNHKFYRVEAYVTSGGVNLLQNPGFETTTDGVNATGWTEFNGGALVNTNNSPLVIHSGLYAMSASADVPGSIVGGGAYQDVAASGPGPYRLTGYLYNWQNSRMTGPNRFAVAQLEFLDSTGGTGNVLQLNESLHFGNGAPLPVNTWQFFEVDATNVPAGTAKVRTFVMYVGEFNPLPGGDSGNAYFDDLTLYQPSSGAPSMITPSVQPSVNVSWPTSPIAEGNTDYQIQSVTNLIIPPAQPVVNVLLNPGFEIGAITNDSGCNTVVPPDWSNQSSGGFAGEGDSGGPITNACYPVHSGIGVLYQSGNQNPPVTWQTYPANPGDVWQYTAYGFVCQTVCGQVPDSNFRGLLKIVWNSVSGTTTTALQPLASDPALVGSQDYGTYPGVTSSPQLSSGSQPDTWIPLEAQATAPPGTACIQFFNITTGSGGMLFDDEVGELVVTNTAPTGWQNLGPVWAASGVTNQVTDPISTKQKFYRVTTP